MSCSLRMLFIYQRKKIRAIIFIPVRFDIYKFLTNFWEESASIKINFYILCIILS